MRGGARPNAGRKSDGIKRVALSVRIEARTKATLRRLARAEGVSIGRLIERHFEKEEEK